MLDGYECGPDEKMLRGNSMDIDEKSTAFSQAQMSAPPPNPRRHTINTMMTTTVIPEPTPPVGLETQRRFSWLPRSATPSLRSPTFRRRTPSPFDDDDYSYSESNPFGEDFREQNELAHQDHEHDHGENPFEDCEYELPPGPKRAGTWSKFKKAMSPKRAISKWRYRKVKHGADRPDDPDQGDHEDPHGQVF